jgi:dCTP deaminase
MMVELILRSGKNKMTSLTDKEILAGITAGEILIHPFNRDQLQNCSYDVRLGEHFYRERTGTYGSFDNQPIFNIWSKESVENVFTQGTALSKQKVEEMYPKGGFESLPDDTKIILVYPGETILAHTEEFIGGIRGVNGQMFARSSVARGLITVCKCAGWGDVGYINRWTMEITNMSKINIIPLIIGEPIAQIVFIKLSMEPTFSYGLKGNYQSNTYVDDEGKVNLERLKHDWQPDNMLPKLYRRFA